MAGRPKATNFEISMSRLDPTKYTWHANPIRILGYGLRDYWVQETFRSTRSTRVIAGSDAGLTCEPNWPESSSYKYPPFHSYLSCPNLYCLCYPLTSSPPLSSLHPFSDASTNTDLAIHYLTTSTATPLTPPPPLISTASLGQSSLSRSDQAIHRLTITIPSLSSPPTSSFSPSSSDRCSA